MSPTDLAYIAGFFDGEGCILIGSRGQRNYRWLQLHMSLTNTDRDVLEMVRAAFGCGRLVLKNPGRKSLQRALVVCRSVKPCYELIWTGAQAEGVLRELYPYLRVKKGQAEIALRYRETYRGRGAFGRNHVPAEILEARQEAKAELAQAKRHVGKVM